MHRIMPWLGQVVHYQIHTGKAVFKSAEQVSKETKMYPGYLDPRFMAEQDFELEFRQQWEADHPEDDREIAFIWDRMIDNCTDCDCDRLLGEWFESDNVKSGDYWGDPDSVQMRPPEDQFPGELEFTADLYWTCEDCLRLNRENPGKHENHDGED